MPKIVTYGEGGYDESKPNNNITQIIDIADEEPVVEIGLAENEISDTL